MDRKLASAGVVPWILVRKIGSNGVPNADDFLPPTGQTLRRAFELLVTTFNERRIRYAIIGGMAIIQYTRVRTTDDIDALLNVPQIALPGLFEALKDCGFSVDSERHLRELRDDGLTTLQFEDVIVDLMRPVLPLYSRVLDRAIDTKVLGHTVRVSTAEGLIVMKLVAMRPQDELDIQELLTSYAGNLDVNYIREELKTFTDESDPRRARFESWLQNAGHQK